MVYKQLHPFCQQKDIVKYCHERSIVVSAYSPLLQGKMDHPILQEIATKVCTTLSEFSIWLSILRMQYHKDAAQILIRWSLQKGSVERLAREKLMNSLTSVG